MLESLTHRFLNGVAGVDLLVLVHLLERGENVASLIVVRKRLLTSARFR